MGIICPLLPCADLVVLRLDAPARFAGKIVVGESWQRPVTTGTVVAVGPEYEQGLAEGDKVTFSKWLTEVEVGGECWTLVKGDDVLARLG